MQFLKYRKNIYIYIYIYTYIYIFSYLFLNSNSLFRKFLSELLHITPVTWLYIQWLNFMSRHNFLKYQKTNIIFVYSKNEFRKLNCLERENPSPKRLQRKIGECFASLEEVLDESSWTLIGWWYCMVNGVCGL